MTTPTGPTLGVYGLMFFNSRAGRDRFATTVATQAAARGFVAGAWPDAGFTQGGNVSYTSDLGNAALRLCWLHSDQAVVDQAVLDLQAEATAQGRSGAEPDVFGSGQVSQLPLARYLTPE